MTMRVTFPCHSSEAADAMLDAYAIETPSCCGLTFEAHDETVTDHMVRSHRLWNAQLHDMADNIERQTRARVLGVVKEAVSAAIFDLPIGVNVDYSRGYSAAVAENRRALLDLLDLLADLVAEDPA